MSSIVGKIISHFPNKLRNYVVKDVTKSVDKPHLVVLGTGWAAISFLQKLDRSKFNITVISPRPHFTFNPLLPSVVGGSLSESGAIINLKSLMGDVNKLIEDEASEIDPDRKIVNTAKGKVINYDIAVYAIGTMNNTFGITGVEKNAYFLKEWEDAKILHGHIYSILSHAKDNIKTLSEEELRNMLHIAVIGAGPTGTEVTAEICDFILHEYPELKDYANITLIDMMDRILPVYSRKTSQVVTDQFDLNGIVNVITNCAVKEVTSDSIVFNSKYLPKRLEPLVVDKISGEQGGSEYKLKSSTVLWASGVKQRPITQRIIAKQIEGSLKDRRPPPGIMVDQYLNAIGFKELYVLGDNAICQPTSLEQRKEELIEQAKLHNKSNIESILQEIQAFYPQIASLDQSQSTSVSDELSISRLLDKLDQSYRSPPLTAQNANQQGMYLAESFNKFGYEQQTRPAYHFVNRGSLCYIGNEKAIFELNKEKGYGLYGSMFSGVLWKLFYSLKQKSRWHKLVVLSDFIYKGGRRRFRMMR